MIDLYISETCPYSIKVMNFLKENNMNFNKLDIADPQNYKKLIESIGGKTTGYYVTGLALITEQGLFTTEISEDKFILSSTISKNNHRGNPLDVMTIDPVSQKFYTDMTDEDFKKLVDFDR